MQPIEVLLQLRFELLQSLTIDSSGSAVGLYPFPSPLQILPLVYLVN
jgi:hypothetical protein